MNDPGLPSEAGSFVAGSLVALAKEDGEGGWRRRMAKKDSEGGSCLNGRCQLVFIHG